MSIQSLNVSQKSFSSNLTNSENFKQSMTINEDVVGKIIVENQIGFPNAPKIYVSFNYDHFVAHPNQRPLEKRNLEKLRKSVEQHNMLPEKPLDVVKTSEYVDDKNPFLIIDGNHRYAISKELGMPIYFIVHDQVTPDDIQRLNYNVSQWSIVAFMHHFISRGNMEYAKFKKFYEDFDLTPFTALPLTRKLKNRPKITTIFREGNFEFHNEDEIREWISFAKEFLHKCCQYGIARKQNFTRKEYFDGYAKLMAHPKFKQSTMMNNIEKTAIHIATYAKCNDYYQVLLYNFLKVRD